jgi:hypothetical protein
MPSKLDVVTYRDNNGDLQKKEVMVEFVPPNIKDETIKIGGGDAVVLQLGPTVNEAFAVYHKNSAFHEEAPEEWFKAARAALDMWAGRHNHTVIRIINEHGRSMNLKLEYQ